MSTSSRPVSNGHRPESRLWRDASLAFDWEAPLPRFRRVRQRFPRPLITDIPAAVAHAMDSTEGAARLGGGRRVAITAGSRGIARIPEVLAAVVDRVRRYGGEPFLVPAMGSHGRGTAEGQRELLADLGITEETVGAPIRATMEVVSLGELANGMPVYMDRFAAEADAIVVVNRVKPHTDFQGEWESGLAKMIAIGLGKQKGADTIHRYGPALGLRELLPQAVRLAVREAPIAMGVATVENGYDELALVASIPPSGIAGPEEAQLLARARALMPSLPFREIDVLVIDEMGKNISGEGMDPNIHGRMKVFGFPDFPGPAVRVMVALGLTPESHGNAMGIGFADVTTRRLVEAIDFEAMYINGFTAGLSDIQRICLPVVAPDDRAAIMTALRVCGRHDPENARVVRLEHTLRLGEIDVSESLWPEVKRTERLSPAGDPFQLSFDREDRLYPFDETIPDAEPGEATPGRLT